MLLTLSDAVLLVLVVAACAILLLGGLAHRAARRHVDAPMPQPPAPPSMQQPVQQPLQQPVQPVKPPGLPRIADLLLVDDSAVARAKLRRLFEAAGYSVQLARDGAEALALLAAGRYAMMITDLEMPNVDGVALISQCLREPATARMPIMAVSGHENLRARFNECGDICGVHRKPWVDDVLLSHVAALIGPPAVPAGTSAREAAPAES